ncbi:MAG: helix-turn-helix transcriptional regulator [Actinomycetia bacterium]|nr:helix-turn-helix transcriptional regulator [Actinomycetes bacterium]
MREPTYYVLLTLLDKPLHGYAIAKRSAELSDGAVTLAAGTLYGALDRLETDGLVKIASEEIVNGRKRRSYTITDAGRRAVLGEIARMRSAVAAAETSVDLSNIAGAL